MAEACCIKGCERPLKVKKLAYCSAHYTRWLRHGDPLGSRSRPRKNRSVLILGDLTYIPLSDEHPVFAVIDSRDLHLVQDYTWTRHSMGYATSRRANTLMHNMILGRKGVDHVNGDGLDNRRSNLRPAPQSLNVANLSLSSHNTSGFKGVSWSKKYSKWEANIHLHRKKRFLGYFGTREEAAAAYNTEAVNQWGDYARLNDLQKGGVV